MAKKTTEKLKLNQLESLVLRKFYQECIIGLLSDEESTEERFFGIDLPILAILSDSLMALDFVKIEYVPVKGITCNANKSILFMEKRLSLKPYKNLIYLNRSIIYYIQALWDNYVKYDYTNDLNLFVNLLQEANDEAEGMAGLTKPNTVH